MREFCSLIIHEVSYNDVLGGSQHNYVVNGRLSLFGHFQ